MSLFLSPFQRALEKLIHLLTTPGNELSHPILQDWEIENACFAALEREAKPLAADHCKHFDALYDTDNITGHISTGMRKEQKRKDT